MKMFITILISILHLCKMTFLANVLSIVVWLSDERVAGWMLMSAYWPTLAITATYVLAVVIGPKLMQQRQPFHFRWTLFFYNLLLVIMNFHICRKVGILEFSLSLLVLGSVEPCV